MRRIVALLSFVILFALLGLRLAQAQNEEAQGQAAEQAGRYREAVNYYVAALRSASEGSAKDQQLREKIIGLVQKLQPPPMIPEEAERYMARGRAAFKAAKNPKDYEEAVAEFKRAARAAPWLGEAYYNLGVVQDKAGQYAEAIRNLKLYLLAAPNAADAKEVKSLIFEVEYRQEKSGKEAVAKREADTAAAAQDEAKQRAERQILQKLTSLAGRWNFRETLMPSATERTWGVSWLAVFDGTFDIAVNNRSIEGWQSDLTMQAPGFGVQRVSHPRRQVLRGTMTGDDLATINWTALFEGGQTNDVCRNSTRSGTWVQLSVTISSDQRRISFVVPGIDGQSPVTQCAEYSKVQYVLTR